jgi:hypothetical protein
VDEASLSLTVVSTRLGDWSCSVTDFLGPGGEGTILSLNAAYGRVNERASILRKQKQFHLRKQFSSCTNQCAHQKAVDSLWINADENKLGLVCWFSVALVNSTAFRTRGRKANGSAFRRSRRELSKLNRL